METAPRLARPGKVAAPHRGAIFAPFTPSYLRHAHAFVGSWHRSGNADIPLHLLAANVAEVEVAPLRVLPNLRIHSVRVDGSSLRDWIVCQRFRFFRDLLASEGYDSMLFLDIDALLRLPLDRVWQAALGGADVAIFERPNEAKGHLKVLCGHILVANSDGGLRFLDATIHRIAQLGFKFFNDQHGTYLGVLDARRTGVGVQQLDVRLVDIAMNETSWIWAGKGWRGRWHWRYRREARRCRAHLRRLGDGRLAATRV